MHRFKEILENGRASEERFKSEAISFFNLSPENGTMSKAMFKKKILDFTSMHINTQKNLTREVQEDVLRCHLMTTRLRLKMIEKKSWSLKS